MAPTAELTKLLDAANAGLSAFDALRGYTYARELGRGGMGAVSLLRHADTGEYLAIKLMRPELATHDEMQRRFLREMRNTVGLRHPNIVGARDAVHVGATAFFTMDYCDGGNVEDLMDARGGVLGIAEAVQITVQCLDGLDYAHHAEIPEVELADGSVRSGHCLVHRDLKPANILLAGTRECPTVRLGDFGLARLLTLAGLSGLTRSDMGAWGTPQFMAREQLRNFKYSGPEVDVWSMAACLYCMLTRHVPRNFDGAHDAFAVVGDADPVPILQRKPGLPRALANVIDEALLETPDAPLQSAAAFKAALVGTISNV
jgi:serine/threonine protein kinase